MTEEIGEPPALVGFCNDCGVPIFGGRVEHLHTGCLGLGYHKTGEENPVPPELRLKPLERR